MRPVRLRVAGFTAFRDEQEIDFQALDLFAIAGATGSGKTSILDAMTYALYGQIDRVGRQAGQFVSQGQTRMRVLFEFEIDERRFRVSRSTPARAGATKAVLERLHDDEWRTEPANGVRETDAAIRRAVGLDYDTFTRTVLLPQGRFADFLVGDAKERREILTDLLGLHLFGRLAHRAGEIRRDATAGVDMHERLLATEYEGVSPEALAEAELAAKEASGVEASLADAEDAVREIAERWSETVRSIRELEICVRDVRAAASAAIETSSALEDVRERATAAERELAERGRAVAAAEKDATKATAARTKAEAAWGTAVDLARLHARAEVLAQSRQGREDAEAQLADAGGALKDLERSAAESAERVRLATAEAEGAIAALDAASRALEDARHADLVAAVRRGVHAGDACPVCGSTIAALPKARRAVSLDQAEAALAKATARANEAHAALQGFQRASGSAVAELEAAGKHAERCAAALERTAKEVASFEKEIAAALGRRLPADPVALVEERADRLAGLEAEESAAAVALGDARVALADAERSRADLATEVAASRARLGALAIEGLVDRARSVLGDGPDLPSVDGAEDADALAATATAIADGLAGLAADLEERRAAAAAGEADAVEAAAGHLAGLLEIRSSTVPELVAEVAAARTQAARAAATAADAADRLRLRLANATELGERIGQARTRAEVFGALASELRQDRLVAFLQGEALELLAAAGSERLRTLSSGRYRLEHQDDEFSVVDTWNGEERRSAKTLSGGETFLASLALALALSEQVRALAVTERARLDSLFLDEGFGTLDPETLEVVVDAIEQLGGDGRTVGVITHVQELAIRLPARIEVEKSPRGSTLRVVA